MTPEIHPCQSRTYSRLIPNGESGYGRDNSCAGRSKVRAGTRNPRGRSRSRICSGTTEETWFDEWEHGIPWENPEFEKFSRHRHAAKFKTPNLIIHNELDFRVLIGQGLSLFTTLQRKGIPAKLLYFPDEGHWVLKPQNSELVHKTVFEWLEGYLKK